MPNVGEANLSVAVRSGRSVVTQQYGKAPLQLHAPLYLDDADFPTMYLRSPSAGLTAGDEHRLRVTVEAGASLELRTQAALQIYTGATKQSIEIELAEDSRLQLLPHPIILGAGAHFSQEIKIRMHATSRILFAERWCAGRIAMPERWQFQSFNNCIQLFRDDELFYGERWELNPSCMPVQSTSLCGEFTHFETLYAIGEEIAETNSSANARQWQMKRENAIIRRTAYQGKLDLM